MKSNSVTAKAFLSAAFLLFSLTDISHEANVSAATPGLKHKPNIIIFLTDDQRWDALGCAGNTIIQTPHLDRLAQKGVRFENTFVTSPICAASRASIFTGTYERSHGHNFGTSTLARSFIDLSYPYLLRKSGYSTGFIGKLGIFTEDEDVERMFNHFLRLERTPYFKKAGKEYRHLTDICEDEAIKFLHRYRNRQPFCLSISFNAPHAEDSDPRQYYWPPAVNHLYRTIDIPIPTAANKRIFKSQPQFLQNSLNRIRWKWRFDTPDKYQEMVKGYYRMVSGVDRAIGRILSKLRQLEMERNTVIIFTSDNGYFLGERGFAGKWLMHEPSIRVPLIVYLPGHEKLNPNRVMEQMVLNVDIAPTILDLAGIRIPVEMQGRSLLPLLQNSETAWRKTILLEHLYNHPQIPQSEAIRTANWKYIRYRKHAEFKELYNIQNDPREEKNLAGDSRFKKQMTMMDRQCNLMIKALVN